MKALGTVGSCIEYVWLNGQEPAELRSKTRVIEHKVVELSDIPDWEVAGPSSQGIERQSSEYKLKPVFFVSDPLRGPSHVIVLCEVFNQDGTSHSTNARALLRPFVAKYEEHEVWFGIEQEYTLMQSGWPLGFLKHGFPFPSGPYYCGVGTARVSGRDLAEEHMMSCLTAGLKISGINAEVMPGQWEFQVGPLSPLEICDQLWLARWLLHRLSEKYAYEVSFEPKPVPGEWNGAGAHTNFSTKATRATGGINLLKEMCEKLRVKHLEHLALYGEGNEKRLSKQRENPVTEFTSGIADRNTSVRIPFAVATEGAGYLEDRRPGANMDPYLVTARLLETLCS